MNWLWQRKKEPPIDLLDELFRLQKAVKTLEARVLGLELEQDAFRNKVLRKVQKARGEEPEETDTTKNLYNGVLISDKI